MPPYRILTGQIKANAQDLETWIRHCLGQHMLNVERQELDRTRFLLHFGFQWTLPSEFDTKEREQYGIRSIHPRWGGAELIEWSDGTTEIIRMWTTVTDTEVDNIKHFDKSSLYQERYQWLQELGDEILAKFELVERSGEKSLDDYPIEYLLQFEKGKTPKALFTFVVSAAYLNEPQNPVTIKMMRRIYKAFLATKDEIYEMKRIAPDAPGIAEFVEHFEKTYPMLVAENMSEDQILREIAITCIRTYKDPKTAAEQSTQFFDNSELIPPDTRQILEQFRNMTIKEASALLAAKPLIEKLENEFFSGKRALESSEQDVAPISMKKPKMPVKPEQGSSLDVWFDWYHAMNKAGFRMTFKKLADESGYSHNTFKEAHRRYKLERGID